MDYESFLQRSRRTAEALLDGTETSPELVLRAVYDKAPRNASDWDLTELLLAEVRAIRSRSPLRALARLLFREEDPPSGGCSAAVALAKLQPLVLTLRLDYRLIGALRLYEWEYDHIASLLRDAFASIQTQIPSKPTVLDVSRFYELLLTQLRSQLQSHSCLCWLTDSLGRRDALLDELGACSSFITLFLNCRSSETKFNGRLRELWAKCKQEIGNKFPTPDSLFLVD